MFKPIGQAIRMGTLCDAMKAKEAELAANAKMLARQCDLARQAENERDEARAELADARRRLEYLEAFYENSREVDRLNFDRIDWPRIKAAGKEAKP